MWKTPDSTKKNQNLLDLKNKLNTVTGYKDDVCKFMPFLHANNNLAGKEIMGSTTQVVASMRP
jgi:hypothetical protein